MTKVDEVCQLLIRKAESAEPGAWLASVASLADEVGASTGTVLAGVDAAVRAGLAIERRRGPDGGFYRLTEGHPAPGRRSGRQRSAAASKAALTRWRGGDLAPGQVERLARAVLAAWVARADLDIARPSREDVPVDEIVMARDLAWAAPLQIKGVARDGLSVHRKYLGSPLLLCYVFLGRGDGGLDSRLSTSVALLQPHTAWQLPTTLGMSCDPDTDLAYRWAIIGKRLAARLEEFVAKDPTELATMLARLAPLRTK